MADARGAMQYARWPGGEHMGGLSPIHWLIFLAIFAIPLPAIIRILRRTGHSGFWSILYFVPIVSWIGLYLLAFADWPAAEGKKQVGTF
jgi:uncharacterized membrane protein YhaH (DUF805 family)